VTIFEKRTTKGPSKVSNNWSETTSWEEVCRRNAGRRAYNSRRAILRDYRRMQVVKLLARYGIDHGVFARIARELGVHRSVISRDFKYLCRAHAPCPCCRSLVPRERLEEWGI
jgi:hypothetical protein